MNSPQSITKNEAYTQALEDKNIEAAHILMVQSAQEAGFVIKLPLEFKTKKRFTSLFHGSRTNHAFHEFNTSLGTYFSTEREYTEGYREIAKELGEIPPTIEVYLKAERPRFYNGEEENEFELFTATRRSAQEIHEAGFDSEIMLFLNGNYEVAVYTPSQIKLATTITYGPNGKIILLSNRFDEGNDIRGNCTNNPQEQCVLK